MAGKRRASTSTLPSFSHSSRTSRQPKPPSLCPQKQHEIGRMRYGRCQSTSPYRSCSSSARRSFRLLSADATGPSPRTAVHKTGERVYSLRCSSRSDVSLASNARIRVQVPMSILQPLHVEPMMLVTRSRFRLLATSALLLGTFHLAVAAAQVEQPDITPD